MDISSYKRRQTHTVMVGSVAIGGNNPIATQSMTNSDTLSTEDSVAQIAAIEQAGGMITRLTAQGIKHAQNLQNIADQAHVQGLKSALVADIHFSAEVAYEAARWVDKVRINPGNYPVNGDHFERLVALCKERGVALRIGVNHGSLGQRIMDKYGDTPRGMVAAAMEYLERCQALDFDQVVVSMKSSNTRVMVHAYRLLVEQMNRQNMTYPLHLGVTEAGNGLEARIKSAVGIGALLADGIGDTIRVSLTEPPQNEIPVAEAIAAHFKNREGSFHIDNDSKYSPTKYQRRSKVQMPIIHSEDHEGYTILEAHSANPTAELRAEILNLGDDRAVMVKRHYQDSDMQAVAIKAAADLGALFLDGLADGIWIDAPALSEDECREIELQILQAARVRQSKTEYIACPSCGRTLFDIESRLAEIKARTSHLNHLKIGVMGCIVNGPGEMADADYGYVGAAAGQITLYRAGKVVEKGIPQREALDHLIEIIKSHGDWIEPQK